MVFLILILWQIAIIQVDRLKAFRGQSCVITHNFGHLSWLLVTTQVARLKAFSLQPEYLSGYGRLRIEDVNEDSCPGRGIGFSHDVLDVFFHRLFGNLKGVCDLFVGPPLCQVLYDGLFAIG